MSEGRKGRRLGLVGTAEDEVGHALLENGLIEIEEKSNGGR
jgi:hypothetical protein